MTKINVVWQSYHSETPCRGYWDQGLLEAIFAKEVWDPVNGFDFNHIDGPDSGIEQDSGGVVIVLPARYHAGDIERFNEDIKRFPWVLIILTGDEEAVFPVDLIAHPRKKVYVMTPNFQKHRWVDRFLGDGWPPDARRYLRLAGENKKTKDIDWSFAGQITHERRQQAAKAMRAIRKDNRYDSELVETDGFTKGLEHPEYYQLLASSKVVICPSGPETPDTFRFYEALEAGCLPIVDDRTPRDNKRTDYWKKLFNLDEVHFPVIQDWHKLRGILVNMVDRFPNVNNKVFAWWQLYKREMAYNLVEDIEYLTMEKQKSTSLKDNITVLIPTSPIKSHPDTKIIEETVASIRQRLPDSEIIIMIDGLREEQTEYRANYEEYIRRLLWKCNFEWKNVVPKLFDTHHHQAAMTREALKLVKTPLVLFVEHDTPLCETIEFEGLSQTILNGDANMIRLHHEAHIIEEHKYLMLDQEPQILNGVPLIRTAQWSQRPHLSSTEFYKNLIDKYFSPAARTMIEDIVHSPIIEAYKNRGQAGWNDFKVWIYAPQGDMKRSYHLDGRGTDPKFEMIN